MPHTDLTTQEGSVDSFDMDTEATKWNRAIDVRGWTTLVVEGDDEVNSSSTVVVEMRHSLSTNREPSAFIVPAVVDLTGGAPVKMDVSDTNWVVPVITTAQSGSRGSLAFLLTDEQPPPLAASGTAWPSGGNFSGRLFYRTDLGMMGLYDVEDDEWWSEEFFWVAHWTSLSSLTGRKTFNSPFLGGLVSGMNIPRKLKLLRWGFNINSSGTSVSGTMIIRSGGDDKWTSPAISGTEDEGRPNEVLTAPVDSHDPWYFQFNVTAGTLNRPTFNSWMREAISDF